MASAPRTSFSTLAPAERGALLGQAVGALGSGRPVIAPTDTVYSVLLSADSPAPHRLAPHLPATPAPPFAWAPVDLEDVDEQLPGLHPTARRVLARLTPGPAVFVLPVPQGSPGAAAECVGLPAALVCDHESIAVRLPRNTAVEHLLQHALVPVVVAELPAAPGRWADEPDEAARFLDRAGLADPLIIDDGLLRPGKPATILRLGRAGSLEVLRQGPYEERFVRKLMRTNILFVCSGNTCRSPMAESIAADELARAGLESVTVESAGTGAPSGAPISPEAAAALRALGVAPRRGASRPLTRHLLAQADLVFAM
ncbi:MAG TPA: Sua5/YciO/YrdC/YwlC family protein, partial [Phycisphaerales bacterium]|nr:Sua5/YciO/YrdC/YwlC family protein [Phycisphaerales bacterium]